MNILSDATRCNTWKKNWHETHCGKNVQYSKTMKENTIHRQTTPSTQKQNCCIMDYESWMSSEDIKQIIFKFSLEARKMVSAAKE